MNIEWSEQAVHDFEEISSFLLNAWGEDIARKFVRSVDQELVRINAFPLAFPASSIKTGIRRCVLSKFNTLYYEIKGDTIYLITIHDNRSDPETLKTRL